MTEPFLTDLELDELARDGSSTDPTATDHDAARARLLGAARRSGTEGMPPSGWPWLAAAAALALVVVGLVWLGDRGSGSVAVRPTPPPVPTASVAGTRTLGTVAAAPGTVWSARQEAGVQTVALEEGSVDVEVVKLRDDERFLVTVGDAEVEVRGTRFEVDAEGGRLQRVVVHRGAVDVRVDGRLVQLVGGERWDAQPPVPAPTPQRARSAPVPRPSVEETDFVHGWNAYRSNDYDGAAVAFGRACDRGPSAPMAEDACYWRAVVLLQQESWPEAAAALRRYLISFPDGYRAGQAALDLGHLLANAGDAAEAQRWFERAAEDPDPAVRDAAADALAELRAP